VSAVRPLALIATATLGLATGAALAGCTLQSESRPCTIPSALPSPSYTGVNGPDGNGLRVVEHGFTQPVNGGVSMGAVVQNTSTSAAYRIQIKFRALDAQGHPDPTLTEPAMTSQEIPLAWPGQRIGAGAFESIGQTSAGVSMQVASFEIVVTAAQWVPADTVPGYRPVTATFRSADRPDAKHPEYVTLTYEQRSSNCRDLTDRGTAAVFRNSAGTIVGGLIGRSLTDGACGHGTSEQTVQPVVVAPLTTDVAHTTLFPYCDLAQRPYEGSGGPFNYFDLKR
jgi:hypothetical protein